MAALARMRFSMSTSLTVRSSPLAVWSAQASTYSRPSSPSLMRGGVQVFPEAAVGAEDISLQEGGQEVDQPGAADALGLHLVDGHEHGFGVLGIDAHFFHRAAGRPHAVADAAPLEGRAGRAGGAGQPLLVADDDLAVGADVDIQGKFGVFKNPGGQDPGHNIPPT